MNETSVITVRYQSIDGIDRLRKYKTLKGARRYAIERVGAHPEFGGCDTYAVSSDGIGKVKVIGCTLYELFGITNTTMWHTA